MRIMGNKEYKLGGKSWKCPKGPLLKNDPDKCLQVYREKDASLLSAAAKCGAIWGGADSNLQEKLMTFGENGVLP